MRFSAIPLPIRLMGGIIIVMVLFSFSSIVHGSAIVIAAVMAWLIVIGALLYSAGFIQYIGRVPLFGKLIEFFSLPQERRSSEKTPAAFNKEEVIESVLKRLQQLIGDHPAISDIQNEIIPAAKACAARKQRLLGAKKAWVAVIYGPPGVGKSTLAEALADLLIGYEAVEKPVKTFIDAPIPGQQVDWSRNLVQGLNGVVIADNARWLAEENSQSQTSKNGELFLSTISTVADKYPGRLAIIMTLTTDQYEKVFLSSKAVNEYLRRMTDVKLACNTIEREPLYNLFISNLKALGIDFDPQLRPKTLKIIETAMKKADFDYANAMQRWAERIDRKMMTVDGPRIATAEVVSWLQDEIDENNF